MSRLETEMAKMRRINAMIKELEPEVRAVAFKQLLDVDVQPSKPKTDVPPPVDENGGREKHPNLPARDEFLTKHSHDKPADNVHLIAAWLFSSQPSIPLTRVAIESLAAEVGIIVPSRPDKTLEGAASDGKSLYQKVERGFRPTVHGKLFFRNKYGVGPSLGQLQVAEVS